MENQELDLIQNETKTIEEQIKSLSIVNQTAYEKGASMKITLSALRKKIELYWTPKVSACKSAYDTMRDARDEMLKPAVALEDGLKGKLKAYEKEAERQAEEARRKAEEERIAKAKAENERIQKEAEARAREEAELFGEKEFVVPVVKEVKPEDMEVDQPLPIISKIANLGIRKTWRIRITDKSKIPLEYMEPNLVVLGGLARSLKSNFKIAGVEAYED